MSRKGIVVVLAVLTMAAGIAVLWLRSRAGRSSATPSADAPASRRPAPGPSEVAAIPGMLRDTIWQRRAAAAWSLAERTDLPVAHRAGLLLEVLEREIASPTNAPVMAGSWPPFTNFLRIHYLHALETLGPDARAPVREAHKGSRGEVREWFTLGLGATMAAEAGPGLRELLAHSPDPDVRMSAARYLGWLKDRDALPVLRAALGDTATALPLSEVRGRPPRRFHPVREQAALALEALGLKVERRGNTFIVR